MVGRRTVQAVLWAFYCLSAVFFSLGTIGLFLLVEWMAAVLFDVTDGAWIYGLIVVMTVLQVPMPPGLDHAKEEETHD